MIIDERNMRSDIVRFEGNLQTSDSKLLNLADNANHGNLTDISLVANQRGESAAQGFNGTTSCIRIPDFTAANVGSEMSCMVSVRTPGTLSGSLTFVSQDDIGASKRGWYLGFLGTKLRCVIIDASGNIKAYSSVIDFSINTYYRTGFTFKTNVLKLFASGVELSVTKSFDNTVNSINNSAADFVMGARLNSNALADPFSGRLCDLIVKNVEMTSEEVYDDYLEFLG